MAKIVENVICPMLKKTIETGYCDELQWIADGSITPTKEEEHLTESDFLICRSCKKRISPNM